jgi:hypothetical protein
MISNRLVNLVAMSCAIPALVSCIGLPVPVDRQVEMETLEFRTGCLSVTRPAYSREHTDCVMARFDDRQHELERLRERVAPPPPPPPSTSPPVSPDLGPPPNFLI